MNTYPELWPGRGEGKDAGGQKATRAKAHGQATPNLPGVPQISHAKLCHWVGFSIAQIIFSLI